MGRSRFDLGWASGFFEGEGWCCLVRSSYGNKSGCIYQYPRVGIQHCDRSMLERFKAIVGVGTIDGPRRRTDSRPTSNPDKWKDDYTWKCQKTDDVLKVIDLLYPHMSEYRQGQMDKVLSESYGRV